MWGLRQCNHISTNCYQIPLSIRSWKLVPATQLTVNYSQSQSNLKLNYRHQRKIEKKFFTFMLSSYVEIHSIFLFPFKRYQVFMLWSYSVNNSDTNYTFLGRHLITHLLLLIQIWRQSHAIIEMAAAEISTLWLLVTQNELSQSEYQNYGKSRHSIPPHRQSDIVIRATTVWFLYKLMFLRKFLKIVGGTVLCSVALWLCDW